MGWVAGILIGLAVLLGIICFAYIVFIAQEFEH